MKPYYVKPKNHISIRPMFIVLLGFLAVMFIGSFLLALPCSNKSGEWQSFTDMFFTSASAVCVTGLIVRSTACSFTGFGQAVILLLIQVGGLGIMTLATLVFMLIRKRITLKDRLALQEVLGQDHIKGIVRLVRNIALMTVIIEATGTILLLPFLCVKNGAIGIWQAVFTSVSAFCNAGFDINGTTDSPYASLTGYTDNPCVLLIVSLLIILGGLGFTVITDILNCKFRFKRYRPHTKTVLISTAVLLVTGTFFFLASEFNSQAFAKLNGAEKFLNSIFQSVTARTAGFNSIDQTKLSQAGKIFTVILMFIGAAPGGTGGGIKVTTLTVLILMGWSGLRGNDDIIIGKNRITFKTGMRAVTVIMLAIAFIMAGTLIITISDTSLTGKVLFNTVSAFTNTGLSVDDISILSYPAKYTFTVLMLIGRLGPLSMGMMFGKQAKSGLKFPPANIMIG